MDNTIPPEIRTAHADGYEWALAHHTQDAVKADRRRLNPGDPRIVCVCASTAHPDLITAVERDLTLAGHVVLGVVPIGRPVTTEEAATLTAVHHHKIRLADEVVAIRKPDGSLGDAVRSEIAYAETMGVPVRYINAEEN